MFSWWDRKTTEDQDKEKRWIGRLNRSVRGGQGRRAIKIKGVLLLCTPIYDGLGEDILGLYIIFSFELVDKITFSPRIACNTICTVAICRY